MASIRTIPRHLYRYVAAIAVADVLLLMGYDLIRPTSQSLVLESFGPLGLPVTWLAIVVATALGVAGVNALLRHVDVVRLYGISTAFCAAILLILWQVARVEGTAGISSFLLYVWKDVYIVLLLEQMWSFCNVVFDEQQAARLYGFFTAMGSIGALGGDLIVRLFSERFGSMALVGVGSVLTAAAALFFGLAAAGAEQRISPDRALLPRSTAGGLALLARSRYLLLITALVFVMQLVITLLDYQFNTVLVKVLPQTDARSAYLGGLYFAVNGIALIVQLAVAPLVGRLGTVRTLFVSPLVIVGGVVAFIVTPTLAVASTVLVAAKGLDYSLTRAAKEMLYLPLTFEEKYKAKAVIDMFVYRAGKGLASCSVILFALVQIAAAGIAPLIALFMPVWFAVLWLIEKNKAGHTPAKE
jgi:ATP:ADP antiporter, AAA family